MKGDFFGSTHQGQERSVNQDRILLRDLGTSQATLMVVADGMGGEAAGDQAAHLTVGAIERALSNDDVHDSGSEVLDWLESLVSVAQSALKSAVEKSPELASMGTTLTMACCRWPELFVVHVGDSRCYLLNGKGLDRLTVDHTVAQRFVEEGVIPADEVEKSPLAHQLWNVVTFDREIVPEKHQRTLEPGDSIVLCSDGLTKHVENDRISATVATADSAKAACQHLIDQANAGGGSDNIAVIVGRFPT